MKNGPVTVAFGLAILLLGACAEATSTIESGSRTELPLELTRNAQKVLEAAPQPSEGWQIGIVLAESNTTEEGLFGKYPEWSISILVKDGTISVLSGVWCDGNSEPDADKALSLIVTPGDLISWKAGKNEVCTDELSIVQKAAVS